MAEHDTPPRPAAAAPGVGRGRWIQTVTAEELAACLHWPASPETPPVVRSLPFSCWENCTDYWLHRYMYRAFSPKRHLEFGTLTGEGACNCLETSAATVWTINLPEGENSIDSSGYVQRVPARKQPTRIGQLCRAVYEMPGGWRFRRLLQQRMAWEPELLDGGAAVGREYRRRGFGHRVCQILCDSTVWDDSNYPPGFFDSVLIDGGHQCDVVLSDTRKTLRLLRAGGMAVWHDFIDDPIEAKAVSSVQGVVDAIERLSDELQIAFGTLYWVRPSLTLVGIRR